LIFDTDFKSPSRRETGGFFVEIETADRRLSPPIRKFRRNVLKRNFRRVPFQIPDERR